MIELIWRPGGERFGSTTPSRSRSAAWAASGWVPWVWATRHRATEYEQALREWYAASFRAPFKFPMFLLIQNIASKNSQEWATTGQYSAFLCGEKGSPLG
jgi:hypothetical protein